MSVTTERRDAGEARGQHRSVWVAALLIGAFLIILANWLELSPWLMAPATSLLMVGFAFSVRETEVSSDSKGDSVYYLGLLFTFIALVAALVAFDWESDATRTIGVIRNFGVALVTTIVGLAGRVWYAMSADAPGDLEDVIRSDLEDAVSEMKGSLDRAREHLEILANTFADVGEAMAATVQRVSATADKAAQTTEVLEEQTNVVAGTVESLAGTMNAFHYAVEGGTGAARGLRESLGGIGDRLASLGKQLASAGADVQDFRSTLAGAQKAVRPFAEAIRESAIGVASVANETASLRGTISGLLRRAHKTNSVIEQIGGHAREADNNVRSTLAEAERHAYQANRSVQGLTTQAGAVGKAFASIRESVGDARDGVANVAASARSLEEQVVAINSRRLSEDVSSARRRGDELGSALSELCDKSGKLSHILTEALQDAEQLSVETAKARNKIRDRREAPGLLQRMRDRFSRGRNRIPDAQSR